jgi:hypothetical protein
VREHGGVSRRAEDRPRLRSAVGVTPQTDGSGTRTGAAEVVEPLAVDGARTCARGEDAVCAGCGLYRPGVLFEARSHIAGLSCGERLGEAYLDAHVA